MGQCLQNERRLSQIMNSNGSCCSKTCLSDSSLVQMEGDSKDYEVLCHSTPPMLCDEWWTNTVKSEGTINVCVMGSKGVGRSALITRLTGQAKYPVDGNGCYDPADCDSNPGEYIFPLDVGNRHCKLDIHSLEECNLIFPHSQRRGDCLRFGQIFLCCFAVNSRMSYQDALGAHHRILRHKEGDSDYSIILVATKCDGDRIVDKVEAMEFAKENGIGYIETSSTENKNVRLLFERSIFEHWAQTVYRQQHGGDVVDGGECVPKLASVSISNSQTAQTIGSQSETTPGSSGHTVVTPVESPSDGHNGLETIR